MLTRDLTQLRIINEALAPGEARALKIQIGDYLAKMSEIEEWKRRLRMFKKADHPQAMIAKLTAIQDKYQAAIDKMEQDAKTGQGAPFAKLIDGIKRNCSSALELFQHTGRTWYWTSFSTGDVVFAKSGVKTDANDLMKQVDKVLARDYGCKAVFSNSEIFRRTPGYDQWAKDGRRSISYMVFPTDKAVFTKVEQDFIERVEEGTPGYLFDRQKLYAAYDMMADNSDTDTPWMEFCNKAGLSYRSRYDVGRWGGFGSGDEWEKQWTVIKEMVAEGKFPKELLKILDPDHIISKESLSTKYDITPGFQIDSYLPDVLCHGQFYAINRKFQSQVFGLLNI